jgi:hypothetical protein
VNGEFELAPKMQKCLFLVNPNEVSTIVTSVLLPGDAIWINSSNAITGNQTVNIARPPGGPPLLLRFAIGEAKGDRFVEVALEARTGTEKKRSGFLGDLQEDDAVKAPEDESDHRLTRVAEWAIGCMAGLLVIALVGSGIRYKWLAAMRERCTRSQNGYLPGTVGLVSS